MPTEPEPVEAFLGSLPEIGKLRRFQMYRALTTLYRWLSGAPSKSPKAIDGSRNRHLGIPNVMEWIKAPQKRYKKAIAYSEAELLQVVEAADNYQDRVMLTLLISTAVRSEAIRNLKDTDLHAEQEYIVIKPKNEDKEQEEVYCPREVIEALRLLGTGYLFKNRLGKPIDTSGVYQRVERCFRRAGITWGKLGPHAFRHSVATGVLENTGDLTLVSKMLGHRNITTTMQYIHRTTASERRKLIDSSLFHRLPEHLRVVQPAMPGLEEVTA